jgi:hypothetical protein
MDDGEVSLSRCLPLMTVNGADDELEIPRKITPFIVFKWLQGANGT